MTDSYDGPPLTPPPDRASLLDGVRFAFGTLTVLPARITRWDRPAARTGMACAPLAGLVVGLLAAVPGVLLLLCGGGPLLAAAVTVAVPAALTRGLHLDGLADTVDGLGSAKPADAALRIMKQSDIGPFGVVALVFVLLVQVAALADVYADSWTRGALAAVVAAVTARLAMTLASRDGVPRPAPKDWARRSPESSPSAPPPGSPCSRCSCPPPPRCRWACRSPRSTRWRSWPPCWRRKPCSGAACAASTGSPATCSEPWPRSRRRRPWWYWPWARPSGRYRLAGAAGPGPPRGTT